VKAGLLQIFRLLIVSLMLALDTFAYADVESYEPNYFVYANKESTDSAIRAHLSFKYEFEPRAEMVGRTLNKLFGVTTQSSWFFSYTGEFDFYFGTRDSGPVVGRVFNPALHFKTTGKQSWKGAYHRAGLQHIDVSLQHRSNGQAVEADETVEIDGQTLFRPQREIDIGNPEFLDSISRSTNFLQFEARFQAGSSNWCNRSLSCSLFFVRFRPIFFEEEAEVTWRRSTPASADFADYDRFEFIYSNAFAAENKTWRWLLGRKSRVQVNWSVGDRGLATDSIDIGLQMNRVLLGFEIPLYLTAHHGPLETLSDHTLDESYVGLGLVFWDI